MGPGGGPLLSEAEVLGGVGGEENSCVLLLVPVVDEISAGRERNAEQ